MPFRNLKKTALAGLTALVPYSALAEVDQTVPSMNPTSNCIVKGANSIDGIRDYSFLNSDDCRSIFVLPEAIGEQHISYELEQSLDLCKAVNIADQRVVSMEQDLSNLYTQLAKIMSKPANTSAAIVKKEKQIASKKKEIEFINNEIKGQLESKDQKYGDIPGARFDILSDGRIIDDHLQEIAKNNYYQFIVQEPGKDPQIVEKKPSVRKANIADSYYSFFYRKAKEREDYSSVISSDAPLKLASESRRNGIVHVEAGDIMKAEMTLNLPSICVGARQGANGVWSLINKNKNPIFTLNRTYTVHQRIPYGYSSALIKSAVVDVVVDYLTKVGANSFSLEDIFRDSLSHNIDRLLDFSWSQQINSDDHQLSDTRVKALKADILSDYIRSYFKVLADRGAIRLEGVQQNEKKDGPLVSHSQGGAKCYQSPLTKLCHKELYSISTWDGQINDELRQKLSLDISFENVAAVDQLEPFQFTSTFVAKFKKQDEE